jgi:hypothetical protein
MDLLYGMVISSFSSAINLLITDTAQPHLVLFSEPTFQHRTSFLVVSLSATYSDP